MKHRGPGSSLEPAREAARAQERARNPVVTVPAVDAGTSLIGTAAPVANQAHGWEFATDPDGNLTASYHGGPAQIIARANHDPRNDEEDS